MAIKAAGVAMLMSHYMCRPSLAERLEQPQGGVGVVNIASRGCEAVEAERQRARRGERVRLHGVERVDSGNSVVRLDDYFALGILARTLEQRSGVSDEPCSGLPIEFGAVFGHDFVGGWRHKT